MNVKALLIGMGMSAVSGLLVYVASPDFLTGVVAAYPKLAVAAPVISFIAGWLLNQPWFAKKAEAPASPVA